MTPRQRSAKPAGQTTGQTTRRRERLPAQLSQVNLDAAGVDVGATSHFVAVPADRTEQPVQDSPPSRQTCIAWLTGCRSAAWRPWPIAWADTPTRRRIPWSRPP